MKRLISSLILICLTLGLSAQTVPTTRQRDSVLVFFPVSKATLNPGFKDNGTRLKAFAERVASTPQQHSWVVVSSGSSPDGSAFLNSRLTRERSESVQAYLKDSLGLSENKFVIDNQTVRWHVLDRLLEQSSEPYAASVLEILRNRPENRRADLLKSLQGGKVWEDMKVKYFPAMRSTFVAIGYEEVPQEEEVVVEETEIEDITVRPTQVDEIAEAAQAPAEAAVTQPSAPVQVAEPAPVPVPVKAPRAYWVKTNFLGWVAFQMNAAAEVELFNHFTFSFPVYYGSFDWFVETVKFNTFAIRPEIRFWLREDCTGLFLALNGTLGLYNYAIGGELRYQDHLGRTPAYGGGLTAGWRLPLHVFGTDRFGLEFAVGASALQLNYDTFYNRKNGNYVSQGIKKMYYGLDNVSVSLTYRFDSKRRFRR
ncbi:MAG: DUF3575 domain-containing protein [Bacteroidales bacterium]|nr:DUF3575 domain-containing protein [Bacteroidales bacterium]